MNLDLGTQLVSDGYCKLDGSLQKIDIDGLSNVTSELFNRLNNLQNAEKAARTNQLGVWEKYRNEFTSYSKVYRLRAFLE